MTDQTTGGVGGDQGGPGAGRPAGPVRQAVPVPFAMPPYAMTGPYGWAGAAPPPRRGRGWIILLTILLIGSIVLNVVLLLAVGALAAGLGRQAPYQTQVLREGSGKVVAVVPLYDLIDGSMSHWAQRVLSDLADDESVGAVVLRIDSPGGTVPASDQIHRAVRRFREKTRKPVVVSQGGYATSGAYYVSAAADRIVAEPTTWTGNIGVVMTTFVVAQGLDKIGIKPVVIRSSDSPFKNVPSLFEEMSPEQRTYVVKLVDSAYKRFVTVVQDGRPGLDPDKLAQIGSGQVFTASDAQELGLIDKIGYQEDAHDLAAELGQIRDPQVVLYSPREPWLLEMLLSGSRASGLGNLAGDAAQLVDGLMAPQVMYLYHNQGPTRSWPKMQYPGP